MENKINKQNNEYIKRINTVLDYINHNYAQELSLAFLAGLANFSKYHFHRIFKGIVGESLYKYLQRIRIEKAALCLKYDLHKSITDIALDCGFTNSASFARIFKEYFQMSATVWRKGGHRTFSKICKDQSNKWKDIVVSPMYIDTKTNNANWRISMLNRSNMTVEVKKLKRVTVAYIRHIGPFKSEVELWKKLFGKLTTWAAARGLLQCPGTQFYTVLRDDLNITDFSKFKTDVCMSVATNTKADGEIGISEIPAGQYVVAEIEIDVSEYEQAWDLVYSDWLPNSGFQPDDGCCFERYVNNPETHPQNKHIIEICIPVKAM